MRIKNREIDYLINSLEENYFRWFINARYLNSQMWYKRVDKDDLNTIKKS